MKSLWIRLALCGDAVIDTYSLHVNSLGDVSTDADGYIFVSSITGKGVSGVTI
jgi:hypothetical protein